MIKQVKCVFLIGCLLLSFFVGVVSAVDIIDPSVLSVDVGSNVEGDVSDLAVGASGVVNVTEVIGSPAIDFRVDFFNVSESMLNFTLNCYYWFDANPAHTVEVYLYNYSLGDWQFVNTVFYFVGYSWMNTTLAGDSLGNFVSEGNFSVRFFHDGNGVVNHVLRLDTLVLSVNFEDDAAGFSSFGVSSFYANGVCTFSTLVTDVSENGLSCFIFSTNNTGVWVNDTAVFFGEGFSLWANVSKLLRGVVGDVVQYQWFANTSSEVGIWSASSVREVVLQGVPVVFNVGDLGRLTVNGSLVSNGSVLFPAFSVLNLGAYADVNATFGGLEVADVLSNSSFVSYEFLTDPFNVSVWFDAVVVPELSSDDAVGLAVVALVLAVSLPLAFVFIRRRKIGEDE